MALRVPLNDKLNVLEPSFDDPIYASINPVVDDETPAPGKLKKSRSIYDDLSELIDDAPSLPGKGKSRNPYTQRQSFTDAEGDSVYPNVTEVSAASDSSSEEEETVTGPRMVKQMASTSSLSKSTQLVLKWKKGGRSKPSNKDYQSVDFDMSQPPDFEENFMQPKILGKDGFGPLSVNNPFLPQSSTLLPAASPEQLEDSLREFAESLVRSSTAVKGRNSQPSLDIKRSVSPVLRPPMLPPLSPNAQEDEKKRWYILERLLMSESALIISLTTAVNNYMKPLKEAIDNHNPILDAKSILNIFGPVERVLEHHKLFYLAITQVAMEWNRDSTIGNLFTSSFTRKLAISDYSRFVCNFPVAMDTLEKAIHRRPKFVTFLKDRLKADPTRLTLQGLLTKPIQRFPQYLLFLQDFLKYTPDRHPDKVSLQVALSHFEGIAEHLDETKKEKYHDSLLKHLKLWGLPYRISELKGQLLRKDEVLKFVFKGEQVIQKTRMLLLFNNKLVCAKEKDRDDSVSSLSIKEGGVEDAKYVSRWVVTLNAVDVLEPDYELKSGAPEHEEYETICKMLRMEHQEIQHDIQSLTEVISLLSALRKEYSNLEVKQFKNYLKALQVMLMKNKAMIRQYEGGRLDISIPSKEGGLRKVRRTYSFSSEADKLQFIEEMRLAKLRGKLENNPAWLVSRDHSEEDKLLQPKSRKLPLFVQSIKCSVSDIPGNMSTDCAVHTGLNKVWIASGMMAKSHVAIVECTTRQQMLTDCFSVEHRVLYMVYVPGSEKKPDGQGTKDASMVWMGCQDGKLLVYSVSTQEKRECLSEVTLPDSITCLVYNLRKVFVGTAGGEVLIFQKNKPANTWNWDNPAKLQLKEGAVRCGCMVKPFLWLGNINYICVVSTVSQTIQTYKKVGDTPVQSVKKMVPIGAGVWITLRHTLKLLLLHKTTHQLLQEVNIEMSITPILKDVGVYQHVPMLGCYISSLLVTPGYLWVGLSNGLIVIYRIPKLEGIPTIMSRPYLAQDSHLDNVRVMIYVNTSSTLEKEQLDKYIEDTANNIGNIVVSNLESKVRDLTLKAHESVIRKESMDEGILERTMTRTESQSENTPYREVTAKLLIGDVFEGSAEDVEEGRSEYISPRQNVIEEEEETAEVETRPRLTSDGDKMRPTSASFSSASEHQQREEQMRKEIGRTIESQLSFAGYESLGRYVCPDPESIGVEDLYEPVDPSEFSFNFKPSQTSERSIHFVLTSARGLRDIRQLIKRTKEEESQTLASNVSCINVYEIPDL